jgi:uncharacterized repeat protein (TIGR02543 family)
MPASSANVTAAFTIKSYTVTFLEGTNGSIDAGSPYAISVDHGSDAVAPSVTPDSGYSLVGWDGVLTGVTSDLTVTAIYTSFPLYELSVVDGTGSGNYLAVAEVDIEATVPAHHHFVNWMGDTAHLADASSANTTVTMPSSNVSVSANVEIDSYTVTFLEGANGSIDAGSPYAITVNHGDDATAPSVTPDAGYFLLGWTGGALSGVTEDLVLTASYTTVPTYILTVVDGTGDGSYEAGTSVDIKATVPVGYDFSGWTGDVAGVIDISSAKTSVDMPSSNVSLTANFTLKSYTVTFLDGASGSIDAGSPYVISVDHGDDAVAPAVTPDAGYFFDAWVGGSLTSITSDVTFTATYTTIPTYILTVTDGTGSGSYEAGTVVSIEAAVPVGYDFAGWTGDTAGVADTSVASTTITMSASAVSLTANFTIKTYTVTFLEGTNGSIDLGSPYVISVDHGSDALAPSVTADAGYTFTGWTSGSLSSVTSNLTLTASYALIPTYALTVIDGTGSGSYETGTVVSIEAIAPDGSSFTGWTGYTAGVADTSASSTTLTMPDSAVTVTATFATTTYAVSYDANSGVGSDPAPQTKSHGVDLTLALGAELNLTGSTLGSWNTASDGSGISYALGGIYSVDADTTLYAQWSNDKPDVDAGMDQFLTLESSGASWTPVDLEAAVWFDASETATITEDGGAVSKWSDKSGNDVNLEQGVSVHQPTTGQMTLNGLNVISFQGVTGAADQFLTASISIPTAAQAYIVAKYSDLESKRPTLLGDTSQNSHFLQLVDNDKDGTPEKLNGLAVYGYFNGEVSRRAPEELSDFALVRVNRNMGPIVNATLSMGKDRGLSNRSFDGSMAEVLIFPANLSTADQEKVEGYLAHKWGLEGKLPESHPYKSSAPGVSTPMAVATMEATVEDSDDLTLSWSVSDGDTSKVSFDDASAEDPTVTFTEGGVYTLGLVADDGINEPVSDEVVINVSAGPAMVMAMRAESTGEPLVSDSTVTFSLAEPVLVDGSSTSINDLDNVTVTSSTPRLQVASIEGEGAGPYVLTFDQPLVDGSVEVTFSGVEDLDGHDWPTFTISREVEPLQVSPVLEMRVGSTQELTTPKGVTLAEVISSDESILSVSGKKLTAQQEGMVNLTLTEKSGASKVISLFVQPANSVVLNHALPDYGNEKIFSLVSFPVDVPTFGELRALLETQLEEMGNANWMVFEYTGDSTTPYVVPNDSVPHDPTQTYWMAVIGDRDLGLEAYGPSLDSIITTTLNPGWNLVGNPYAQEFHLEQVFVKEGSSYISMTTSEQSLVAPMAWKLNSTFDDYLQVTTLGVGEGSWVYNDSSEDVTLYIDPTAPISSTGLSKATWSLLQPPSPPKEKTEVGGNTGDSGGTESVEAIYEVIDRLPSGVVGGGTGGGGGCLLR